jgi:branched-chain amino acid transport system substrate-binding protein
MRTTTRLATRLAGIFVFCGAFLASAACLPACKKDAAPARPGKSTTATSGAASAEPIKVGGLFAITGPASNLGAPEDRTARMLVDKMNRAGGVLGRPIQLIVKDTGGDPQKALSLARQLIEDEKVLAIIGPSTSGETLKIKELCQENKTILISCAAAETIVSPIASYVFKTPQKDSDVARAIFKVMKDKGISNAGVIVSNDGFGQAGKSQLEKLAPESGVTIAIAEAYGKEEMDLSGVLTKVKGKDVQAVINWSIVPAQAGVARTMKQIGLDVPLFQSHGYGNIKYVKDGGDAANGTIFPCGRLLVAEALPDDHPQKKVLVEYKKDYEAMYKEDASTFGGHAYDGLLILAEAIRKAGGADGEKVRSAIEGLQGLVGTAGVFNFSQQDHNGLAPNALEILTVKDGQFAVYKN